MIKLNDKKDDLGLSEMDEIRGDEMGVSERTYSRKFVGPLVEVNEEVRHLRKSRTRGIATMPVILAFGVLIVVVALLVATLGSTESFMSARSYQSGKALLFAESGARDALLRIARDKHYVCAATDCYSIDQEANGCSTGAACARIQVSSGVGTALDPKVVTAKGIAGNITRTLRVSVVLDTPAHGAIASTTWQEVGN